MAIAVDPTIMSYVCQVTSDPNIQAALVAIAHEESGWNAGAQGDCTVDCNVFYGCQGAPAGSFPTSFGYLQLHTSSTGCPPGLGNGYGSGQLLDPIFNLRVGADYLAAGLAAGSSLTALIQSQWTTWPTVFPLLSSYLQQGITPGCTGGGGCTDPSQCTCSSGTPTCTNGVCGCSGGGGGGGGGGCDPSDIICQISAWWSGLDPTSQLAYGAFALFVASQVL